MRRITMLLTVALVIAAMMLAMAMPALAKEKLYDCGGGLVVTKEEAKAVEKEFNVKCTKVEELKMK